ncbi:hypothetical protein ONS95_008734 [Cadophora gregata]|uniref:uncharacterized protein n=1 Tax=Cadophora gregata TaxID=51156 RepID=UPI0026DD90EB|nr:uncharacterized protein ONS95_008734 [Cadophora gregata]KAK0123725.1 hypothetical protein ONS95_008734 [Cadophora gregata]KAK0130067.1 hypothetical protein ONS96_000604 [Cadophora gregata f. sp. sojae]
MHLLSDCDSSLPVITIRVLLCPTVHLHIKSCQIPPLLMYHTSPPYTQHSTHSLPIAEPPSSPFSALHNLYISFPSHPILTQSPSSSPSLSFYSSLAQQASSQ